MTIQSIRVPLFSLNLSILQNSRQVRSYFSILLLVLLATCSFGCSCGNERKESTASGSDTSQLEVRYADQSRVTFNTDSLFELELPALKPGQKLIRKSGFTLVYNERFEQAEWVAYELTAQETQSAYARTDKFMSDPAVRTESAAPNDYKGSGYDRGHLAPAGDMGWSYQSMAESFYMSNMSPQTPGFNRGIWKRLEELVRTWAVAYGAVSVVTAGILEDGLTTIGYSQVAVPNYYYKVILDHTGPDLKAIAFIMPNIPSKASLQSYVVSVDEVERVTGINFFPALDDQIEEQLESKVSLNQWTWRSSSTYRESGSGTNDTPAVQCSGTTKKGLQCRNRTKDPSGRCHHHR